MMDGGDAPSAKFTLKESISRTFGTGFLDGSITAVSAEKATMAPPGAPPMGLPMMLGMIGQVKEAFPQWESLVQFVELQDDGTCIVGTQQVSGPMTADMPAMGPFPEVKLETAPELAKKGVVFPVEVGLREIYGRYMRDMWRYRAWSSPWRWGFGLGLGLRLGLG